MKAINSKFRISTKAILILVSIVLVISLIPILYIAKYDLPQDDDFGFSATTHQVICNGGSFIDAIISAANQAIDTYYTWQGTFSAVFLMALQPAIWGPQFYGLTVYILVFSLLISISFMLLRLLSDVIGLSRTVSLIISFVICIYCIQFIPSQVQGLFWYNGAIYYTFFQALVFLAVAICIGFCIYDGWWRIAILSLLSFFIGGGNYSSALFLIVLYIVMIILSPKCKKSRFFIIIPEMLLIISVIISAVAPGNSDRISHAMTIPWIAETILLCFSHAFQYIVSWVGFSYWGLLLFILPISVAAVKGTEFKFRYPLIVTLFSFCLLSSMFAPTIYTLRVDGSSRQINIYFYTFIILSVLNLLYWCGWIVKKSDSLPDCKSDSVPAVRLIAASFLSIICVLMSITVSGTALTSIMAIGEIRSGEAKAYYEESMERYDVLSNSGPDVVLNPIANYPYLLFERDMTDDPEYYMNKDFASYFGKTSVIVK